jgi:uncharacterized membrane protein YvlD (DUF360 family)
MESLEFWGVSFRSVMHMQWFQASVCVSMVCMLLLLLPLILKEDYNPIYNIIPVGFFSSMHFTVFLSAVVLTKGGAVNGNIFSVDCIWFNALMAFIYAIVCLIIWQVTRKSKLHPIKKANPQAKAIKYWYH